MSSVLRRRAGGVVTVVLVSLMACTSSTTTTSPATTTTPTGSLTVSSSAVTTSVVSETTLLPTNPPSTASTSSTSSLSASTTAPSRPTIRTGAEHLVASNFAAIAGANVGLISHQNSIVDGQHLADHLANTPEVELVALFGPEHGARSDRDAGEYVEDAIDAKTGVPIYSLFGETRQPTAEMLEGIDVLLFDLQDVGARYYTYISTMGLAMQAAAVADIEFVVLDRPNPLGGRVAGGVLDTASASFVGLYPLPDTHGLTVGELALAVQTNGWLDGLEGLRLSVVEMDGWDATMRWHDTGRPWIAPSPALTTFDSALIYPATVYLEASSLSYGRGTARPFTSFGAPWLQADRVAAELNARELPGLRFTAGRATPEMLPGMTVEPAYLDKEIPVVEIDVTNASLVEPVAAGTHILELLTVESAQARIELWSRPEWLDQLSGSSRLRAQLIEGADAVDIIERQHLEMAPIEKELERHHLYVRSG